MVIMVLLVTVVLLVRVVEPNNGAITCVYQLTSDDAEARMHLIVLSVSVSSLQYCLLHAGISILHAL